MTLARLEPALGTPEAARRGTAQWAHDVVWVICSGRIRSCCPATPKPKPNSRPARSPAIVAAAHPAASVAWATLAEEALADDKAITAYAYARTGYHRGLDQLRRNGWKGFGPVPYRHEPNRGFLRCVAALARAADAIGETDEYARCLDLLDDCDPSARAQLGLS